LGKPKALNAQTMYIGRDPARAQIVFTDRSVSRLHARIVEESDNVFVLHDEGSSSGTYVNGDPVTASHPHHLHPGDRIEFGRVEVIFLTSSSGSEDLTEVFLSQA
jgi:pSer/pThr/pTyr-binding forkhead associated (FHA) protein